jgi:hypothetical protein
LFELLLGKSGAHFLQPRFHVGLRSLDAGLDRLLPEDFFLDEAVEDASAGASGSGSTLTSRS